MQVILLEKLENLGGLGELVDVRAGYARNYLLPSGKAKAATPANLEEFESRRAELERLEAEREAAARSRGEKLDGLVVTIAARAGTEGKLFGSVGTAEIAAAAAEAAGVELEKREVRLPEGTLRHVGEYSIELQLHSDISPSLTVIVEAEAEA